MSRLPVKSCDCGVQTLFSIDRQKSIQFSHSFPFFFLESSQPRSSWGRVCSEDLRKEQFSIADPAQILQISDSAEVIGLIVAQSLDQGHGIQGLDAVKSRRIEFTSLQTNSWYSLALNILICKLRQIYDTRNMGLL